MADSLHLALSAFRDTMLTAVARLEFAIRDTENSSATQEPEKIDSRVTNHLNVLGRDLDHLSARHSAELNALKDDAAVMKYDIGILIKDKISLYAAVQGIQEQMASLLKATEETKELLKIPAPTPATTRNVLISTPALTSAVTALAAEPPAMDLDEEEEEVQYQDVQMNGVGEGEVVEEEEESDGLPDLRQVTIKGKQYFMDSENSVYVETDEGYEEIGKYNPALDCIEGAEEEEADVEQEEEEDEEAVEVEEFVYKNKTYQRDNENNVYDDGEHIGTWNGKKIVPLA